NHFAGNVAERVRRSALQHRTRRWNPGHASDVRTSRRACLSRRNEWLTAATAAEQTKWLDRRNRVIFKSVIYRELVVESMIDSYQLLPEVENPPCREVQCAGRVGWQR